MPYIKNKDRVNPNRIVELMKNLGVSANGDLKYILKSFCKKSVALSYNNYKNFLGELNESRAEIKRRMLKASVDICFPILHCSISEELLDDVVQFMIDLETKVNGDLNYILYKLCLDTTNGTKKTIELFMFELEKTVDELRKEILAEYEDEKIFENGDV